ncbi:uncharacterized protein N7482_005589 [Penicillium canariense]|uniref:RecA family profile 1 domain-containing protein n=1 Tax=Penicillium canariense TaxID=189055 RepID=A0A9W9LNL2_9EURO|nr:uncharacterized protein N7482_005589 [Penicillium canariense]KAJ5166808.1 hypothetical protein N7482_005589 [Penicillium canariense]
MDLLAVLPDFATRSYAHILPPLERSKITTVDLITLDTLEVAKRAHVPPADVRRLSAQIIEALHADLGFEKNRTDIGTFSEDEPSSSINLDTIAVKPGPATKLQGSRWNMISTLDPAMDALLGGGIPTGYVTEVTGESGSGKTQFLLSLLLAAQLAERNGLQQCALYISTEHPLATNRLSQLLECHPYLSSLPADKAPSLENVISMPVMMDLETQDHVLNYQLPVAIANYNIGLVIIDSITSNYRAEHSSNNILAISTRSSELAKLGQLLRNLAAKEDIAIVLANQVSDRFEPVEGIGADPAQRLGFPSVLSQSAVVREAGAASPLSRNRSDNTDQQSQYSHVPSSSPAVPSSPHPAPEDEKFDGSYIIENPARNSILSLSHQERFFTGWGDGSHFEKNLKTPALGYFWSTQIACRIALKKEERRPVAVSWEGGGAYPASTSVSKEQGDFQDNSEAAELPQPRTVISSAREAHTAEAEAEYKMTNEENQTSDQPKKEGPSPKSMGSPLPEYITRRTMKLVFAPWKVGPKESTQGKTQKREHAIRGMSNEVAFEIWKGGLRSIHAEE